MVKLDKVKKQYNDFRLNCSIEIPKGQVTGVIGRNGAGKTTMFKAILGLIKIDSGNAELFGKDVCELTAQEKQRIGAVLADSGFCGYLSIKDYVPMLAAMYSDFSKEKFVSECERMQLPIKKKIKDFSSGMKRKLQILTALSHNADLLVLDEPTVGLDVIVRDEILEMLQDYMKTEEKSIIISSHISSDLEGICDDIYMIDKGNIVMHEDTDVILGNYGLLKVTRSQFEKIDKTYLINSFEADFGYNCITNQKQFYLENYPDIVIENGSLDLMMRILTQK
ncbi:MAG: ABC transporter ATP-binding protein [Lachnospiraceae bacterium]|nr:ABC transporter ATP-binding protein [Lachnospiraceae bacterium]